MRKNGINVGKNSPYAGIFATDRNGCTKSINAYYAEQGSRFVYLEKDDEKKLLIRIQEGDKKAERELFFAHARFVISVAKNMHRRYRAQTRAISLNDFIQWGNMGMIRAMYRCNPSYDNRFLSYAVYWIEAFMDNHYQKYGQTIFLPNSQKRVLRELRRHQEMGDELIELYSGNEDVDYRLASDLVSRHTKAALLIPRYYHALDDCISVFISVDDTMPIETSTESILFSDDETDLRLMNDSFLHDLEAVLNSLTNREKYIVILFFGLKDFYEEMFNDLFRNNEKKREWYKKNYSLEMTLEEIGEIFNLTLERVRQIKDKALQRMRHTRRSKFLKTYL